MISKNEQYNNDRRYDLTIFETYIAARCPIYAGTALVNHALDILLPLWRSLKSDGQQQIPPSMFGVPELTNARCVSSI